MAAVVIDEHLDKVGRALAVRGRYRDRVLDELRAHLEDAVRSAEASGLTRDEAERQAIEQLGSIDALVVRLRPRATRWTRALAAAPVIGVLLALASVRAANAFHAEGGRLWTNLPYTVAWMLGWLSIPLLCGPVFALLVRHRGALGRAGALAAAALACLATAVAAFHFSNDGSFDSGEPSTWRAVALAAGVIAIVTLAVVVRRNQLVARWPLVLAALGTALLVVHYGLLGGHGVGAGLGAGFVATAGLGYTLVLIRERPLA